MISQICLDMDGVLCDFVSAALQLHGVEPAAAFQRWPRGNYRMEPVIGISRTQFWHKIHLAGAEFWADLKPFPWASVLLEKCRVIAPTIILTAPSSEGSSHVGKLWWLKKHFGSHFRDYLMGAPKHFCARPGAVLIDDHDANCDAFIKNGGHAITCPAIWNSQHENLSNPLGFILTSLKEIEVAYASAAGEAAFAHQIKAQRAG